MSAETKNPPPSWAGGLEEKKSYSVGLSRFQSDRVKTVEGSEGGADFSGCGDMDFGILELVGEGVNCTQDYRQQEKWRPRLVDRSKSKDVP